MEEPTLRQFFEDYPTATIETPKYAWRCTVTQNFPFYCKEGQQPNAFRRLMQRIVLGFKWERVE